MALLNEVLMVASGQTAQKKTVSERTLGYFSHTTYDYESMLLSSGTSQQLDNNKSQ